MCGKITYFVAFLIFVTFVHPNDRTFRPYTVRISPEEVHEEALSSPLSEQLNLRPIIGILSQDLSSAMQQNGQLQNFSSYIAASYVKFIEAAGARVVPVKINQKDDYYEMLTKSVNGLLFPGGGLPVTDESGYGRAGRRLFDSVSQAGKEGRPLPLWATCLGFEMVMFLTAGHSAVTRCEATNVASKLRFQPGYRNSTLFRDMPEYLIETLSTKNITSNFHHNCVLPKTFHTLGIDDSLRILTTSLDVQGMEYVSTIEHKNLPIFGTQWHPEKAAFEWLDDPKHNSIQHDLEAIRVSQALAEVFVHTARKNNNRFVSRDSEDQHLIYNYLPLYVQPLYSSSFEQCYFFYS